jgi:hypothetical protein
VTVVPNVPRHPRCEVDWLKANPPTAPTAPRNVLHRTNCSPQEARNCDEYSAAHDTAVITELFKVARSSTDHALDNQVSPGVKPSPLGKNY